MTRDGTVPLFLFFITIVCAAAIWLTGCPTPVPPPVPPTPVADASAVMPGTCASACAHYRVLKCPAGQPTAKGVPCETVCANANAVAPMNLTCRTTAFTCAAADACELFP